MSSKEFSLFSQDKISYKHKFYILMDLLITNQNSSRSEAVFFMLIFYIQIISGFYSEFLGVFDPKNSTSDKIFNYIEKIFRFKDLLIDKYSTFKTILIIVFLILVFFSFHFIYTCYKIKKTSFYSYSEMMLNFYIKFMIYICSNMIFDLTFANFCFDTNNPYFKNISCKLKDNFFNAIISILIFIIASFFTVLIQFFYCDAMYLSTSFYSRIACNYELYSSLNTIIYSFLLSQVTYLSKEVFLLYNLIMSSIQFKFFIEHYPFYDKNTNILAGLFHILYVWTSAFSLIFAYIDFQEKGIIYLVSSVIILYFYFNLKYKIEEKVFLDTPFYKIKNRFHLLYYIKNLIDKMNHVEENPEDKALLSGIMQMHLLECPSKTCLTKNKNKLYLPITNEWSDRSKLFIEDRVFMINFIASISQYFITQNTYSPDLVINLSLYYLEVIGNYCLSMFYYKKSKEMKMTLQEQFSFIRLRLRISKSLVEKLKGPNEPCPNLEDLNVTNYFKYEDLSQNFIDEINNDINLSLDFWKIFRKSQIDITNKLNFNKIFHLTDKIRITKEKIEVLWDKLIKLYNGVNELFHLYFDYIEQINDDEFKKRELESLRRKNDNITEHLSQNFYSLLFSKETGIIIANGDKGKEGLIERTNNEIENIFKYKSEELKGMNVTSLMPKIFAKIHRSFIEKYYNYGEKKIIDKKDMKTFGKDKDNAIIMIRIGIKLFPMLNDSVYFVGLVIKENVDDVIFLDSQFNIQGMSAKLLKILNCDNKILFQNNEIPFYLICKKFVNFYKIFLQGKKKDIREKKNKNTSSIITLDDLSSNEEEESVKNNQLKNSKNNNVVEKQIHDNIEINENIELEYEIRLPQFLIDYSDSTNKRLIKLIEQNKAIQNGTLNIEVANIVNNEEEGDNNSNNSSIDEFGESDLLVDDNDRKNVKEEGAYTNRNEETKIKNNNSSNKDISNITNNLINSSNNNISSEKPIIKIDNIENPTPTPTPNGITPTPDENLLNVNYNNNDNVNGDSSKINQQNANLDFNKKSEEEKDFIMKVKQYKELFTKGKFDELDELIDDCNRDSNSKEYKFNFTFDKYKFGIKNISYIVRCIDSKNEGINSDNDSIEERDEKLIQYKKEKVISIKPLFEVLYKEKELLLNQENNLINIIEDNLKLQKLISTYKEDIHKMSIVHGQKKAEDMLDENASQNNHAPFNADLVKKNRIEEIRANLLNNISNFFTLKYIKAVVFLIGIFSLTYGIVYIYLFLDIYEKLKLINESNINLFQSTLWMNNLIGTIISLSALYKNKLGNNAYNFNSYIQNNYEYFSTMKELCFHWYDNITDKFGELEDKIYNFISDQDQKKYFWDNQNITYTYKDVYDFESFPLAVSQSLSNINSVLKNNYYSLNISQQGLNENSKNYIEYIIFMTIENSFDNLLPNQYEKLKTIPTILCDYNSKSNSTLIIILLIYSSLMVILCINYGILLHLTNENMGEGFEKVSKIKLEKIEDTIKRIQNFNVALKKFREKEEKKIGEKKEDKNQDGTTVNPTAINTNNTNNNNRDSMNNGFNIDAKKYTPLTILNWSYFQTLILFVVLGGFLIPIFYITNLMVNSTNKIINVEEFIFGKILIASSSTVKVKCFMLNCDTTINLEFSELISKENVQDIVQGISIFNNLDIFYNDKFLLDACASIHSYNSSNYENCIKDELIQSANNTESLLKLIQETIDNIYKDYKLKKGKIVTLKDGTLQEFKNEFLYESNSFYILEYVFYNYISPVSDNFSEICNKGLLDYLNNKRNIVVFLLIMFSIIIIGLCIYIGFFFVNRLIHLLSVSRCILKIIPTSVINNTQELEMWIESKY